MIYDSPVVFVILLAIFGTLGFFAVMFGLALLLGGGKSR